MYCDGRLVHLLACQPTPHGHLDRKKPYALHDTQLLLTDKLRGP
jgi:hypothetical protein